MSRRRYMWCEWSLLWCESVLEGRAVRLPPDSKLTLSIVRAGLSLSVVVILRELLP
jgi:hypothetical protein